MLRYVNGHGLAVS